MLFCESCHEPTAIIIGGLCPDCAGENPMARGKQRENLSLAEKVRRYPNEQKLSNKAAKAFNDTYKIQHKLVGAQPAFVAAKAAVEAIPRDERYRKEDEEEE